MKRENNIVIASMIMLSIFVLAVCFLVFICKYKEPDKYKYLPLEQIESVTATDDGVIIMVTESGDHYAFEVDERR